MTREHIQDESRIRAMLVLLDSFLSYPSLEAFETLMGKYHKTFHNGVESDTWCWAVGDDHCFDCRRLTAGSGFFSVCALKHSRHDPEGFKGLWNDNQGPLVIMMTQFREFILETFPDIAEEFKDIE